MTASIRSLKPHYRSGVDILASDFFAPCLREAQLYRRAAGYFSSMALLTWAEALPRLIEGNSLKIRLIASPELSSHDISVFKDLSDESRRTQYREVIVERVLEEII